MPLRTIESKPETLKLKNQNMKHKFQFGFDIGSISINTVVMDESGAIIADRYDYCHGKPFEKLKEILDELEKEYSKDQFARLSFTGTGGKLAAQLLDGFYVNEIVAQSTSVARLYPQAQTIIEMGGEDSKLIFMENGKKSFPALRFRHE